MPGFITDAVLTAAVLDQRQETNDDGSAAVPRWMEGIVVRANVWAYQEIVGRLAERGYTKAQIDQWDRGAEFQTDLGVWKALVPAAAMAPEQYSLEALREFDRRAELAGDEKTGTKPVAVLIAGVFTPPAGTAGQVSVVQEDTSSDLFVPRDDEDPRIGQSSEL